MKITNRDIIHSGEQELIDTITSELDWGVMEEIFEKEHRLKINEDIEYKNGDIVVHDEQIAYQLEFDAKVTISVLLDRNGSCLSLTSSADIDETIVEDEDDSSDGAALSAVSDIEHDAGNDEEIERPGQHSVESMMEADDDIDESDLEQSMLPEDVKEKISQVALNASDVLKEINGESNAA